MGGVVCVGPEIPTLRGVAVHRVFDDALEGVFLQAHKNQTAWMMEAQRSLGGVLLLVCADIRYGRKLAQRCQSQRPDIKRQVHTFICYKRATVH